MALTPPPALELCRTRASSEPGVRPHGTNPGVFCWSQVADSDANSVEAEPAIADDTSSQSSTTALSCRKPADVINQEGIGGGGWKVMREYAEPCLGPSGTS
ncbi:Putative protein of unknown function [Podospora comata]|uniref:Uncharacterized protein n=1 Tax=Podospora comata TaxID=48703 RepID=A0ABY6SKQ5_PODCO|nr:Putative protein of unknown function [Podospora comata]